MTDTNDLTEREKQVVAWLRKKADNAITGAEQFYRDTIAAEIERGEHLQGGGQP